MSHSTLNVFVISLGKKEDVDYKEHLRWDTYFIPYHSVNLLLGKSVHVGISEDFKMDHKLFHVILTDSILKKLFISREYSGFYGL